MIKSLIITIVPSYTGKIFTPVVLITILFCDNITMPARLAQSVEHETLNLRVVGSSPTSGENIFFFFFFFCTFFSFLFPHHTLIKICKRNMAFTDVLRLDDWMFHVSIDLATPIDAVLR